MTYQDIANYAESNIRTLEQSLGFSAHPTMQKITCKTSDQRRGLSMRISLFINREIHIFIIVLLALLLIPHDASAATDGCQKNREQANSYQYMAEFYLHKNRLVRAIDLYKLTASYYKKAVFLCTEEQYRVTRKIYNTTLNRIFELDKQVKNRQCKTAIRKVNYAYREAVITPKKVWPIAYYQNTIQKYLSAENACQGKTPEYVRQYYKDAKSRICQNYVHNSNRLSRYLRQYKTIPHKIYLTVTNQYIDGKNICSYRRQNLIKSSLQLAEEYFEKAEKVSIAKK